MPNIYNPTDLSDLDAINAQINAIKTVLPASNGTLINTEENAIDVVGKALKNGSINNSGVEILYDTGQDANNEISIRLKSAPNTLFYADQTGLLVPLTIGNGLKISNGDLNTVNEPRSKIKNKLLYTTTYQHNDWYGELTPENLYNGEGGNNGIEAGANGMIAANTSVVVVTVNFDSPKWLNKFKLYQGEPNSSYWAEPHLVEVFAGNTTEVFLSSHSLRPSTVETIDTSCLESYTSAGKQTQYTFKFTSTHGYVALRELVLWGDN
jgi:hypothetical protein